MFEDIVIEIHIVYNTQKVGNYFSLKDSINHMYQSCLVYKFTCPGDLNNQCIGETERQFFVRIKEYVAPTNNAVFKHIEKCAFCRNCNIYNSLKLLKSAVFLMIIYLQKLYKLKNFN